MRIQRTQHADDRRFEDIVIVEFPAVDVLVLNQLKRLVKIMLNQPPWDYLRPPLVGLLPGLPDDGLLPARGNHQPCV